MTPPSRLRAIPWLLSVALYCIPMPAVAQESQRVADATLQSQLESITRGFRGTVGVYVHHLTTGATAGINADTVFPTASMIKVPILIGVFDRIERGELGFLDTLTYTDSLLYPGEDILGSFADSAIIPLAQVLMLTITTSDNTAALWSQHLAGTGTAINAWLARHGFASTRVNSRTPGREEARQEFGWGQTSPREIAELLVMLREGRAVSPAASEAMYRHLTNIYWAGEALSEIPPWVQVASKQGAVNQSRSEVLLVNAPSGDYVLSVITKRQVDESWTPNNEGYVLLRDISRAVWRHFEPMSEWQRPKGADRYVP
jgi:beta-lactamase class A